MGRKAVSAIVGVLLAATLFVAGMLTERAVALSPAHQGTAGVHSSQSGARLDRVVIHGQAAILAYHADGTRFAMFQGHNQLTPNTINSLALCLSGINPTPVTQTPCSNWTTAIFVQGTLGSANTPATNSIVPSSCFPVTNTSPPCTGWQITGTVDNTIVAPFTIEIAGAGCGASFLGPPGTCNAPFDIIPVVPNIRVLVGDRVIVTITFTVA